MSLFKRGEIWWLYVVHHGRRIRKSTETNDRRSAQRIHDEFKAKLWKHKPGRTTFHGALEAWAQTAGSSDQARVGKLKRLYSDRPLIAVTAESLQKVLPSNPGTFNRYVNVIKAVLHQAGVELKIKRPKQPPGRVRWLTAEEWERLDQALPDYLRPLARFAIATGLRRRNVVLLEWSQVDLGRRVAWLHAEQTKSKRAIGIPLSDAAMAVLRSQKGIHERWVFPKNGNHVKAFDRHFQRAVAKAKIKNFRWHDLRHTWASWHVSNGTRLEVLRELGGWGSLQMVLRYAHLAPDHLATYANNAIPRPTLRHKRKKVA